MVDSYTAAKQFCDSLEKDPDKSAAHVEKMAAYVLLDNGFNKQQKIEFYRHLPGLNRNFEDGGGYEVRVSYKGPEGTTAGFAQETEEKIAGLKQYRETQRQNREEAKEEVLRAQQRGGLIDQIAKGLNAINPLGSWDNSRYENPFGP